ncbi:actin-related protein 10 isoform X2 [Hydra vulgaris]|uniref:Actin-related protein 10 isoform X2 n=1 Tax=Hydra vulgaris TaxID=6087 RepID=A0ABM4DEX7_HYDVU
MALMDLISLGADKQAVIFDIGAAFTKIGFAGEFSPRHIIRSEIKTMIKGDLVTSKLFKDNNNIDCNELREFFHMIYFKYLLVNPKERRVVICDSILKSINVRNLIAQVLFKDFEIISLCFISSHLLAVFSLGLKTGLVIDCGYTETTVVPIFEELPILSAMEYINLAGKTVHQHINDQILKNGIVESNGTEKLANSVITSIDEVVLEDIKTQCCFVGRFSSNLIAVPVKYYINGGLVLNVSGKLRACSLDILFQGNDDDQSITTTILDAILKCPIDCRKLLAENIVVVGGTCMSTGFLPRLYSELNHLITTEPYKDKLFLKKFVFHKTAIPENCSVWLGGAMFSALELLAEQSISREAYQLNPKIPDWSSILSVSKEDLSKSHSEKYKWEGFRKTLPLSNPKFLPVSYSSELIKKDFSFVK